MIFVRVIDLCYVAPELLQLDEIDLFNDKY